MQHATDKIERPHSNALKTAFCRLVKVDYPIVQTGMGWVSGPRLTAATSEAGGFGILAAVTLSFDELVHALGQIREATERPYGVNLRADQPDVGDRIELLIREEVPLVSFAGAPRRDLIDQLKTAGILTMPTIGAVRHAVKMAEWGVDALIAQGHEGGGHTGPVPTTLLLPPVCEAVDIPVLAAGGFYSGQGLVSALAYGAAGIAMGTRFLLTAESGVPDAIKAQYLKTSVTGTVVTKAVDGYPQRVITTPVVHRLESAGVLRRLVGAIAHALRFRSITKTGLGDLIREGLAMRKTQSLTWSQLAMAANAPMMTRASLVDGNVEVGILPTGQVTGLLTELPAVDDVVHSIIDEAEATLARLRA
jgi:NAD(P)H-dependent flavin oxidoreductase YrpB (nitropropane dioxygenase family)